MLKVVEPHLNTEVFLYAALTQSNMEQLGCFQKFYPSQPGVRIGAKMTNNSCGHVDYPLSALLIFSLKNIMY